MNERGLKGIAPAQSRGDSGDGGGGGTGAGRSN